MAKNKNAIRDGWPRRAFLVANGILFAFILFLCLYPMWYVVIQSLSDGNKGVGALFLPKGFTLSNYAQVLTRPDILDAFALSVVRTVSGTVLVVICCMLLGYLFTKESMPYRKFLYRMLIITSYVGGGMIPTYLVYKFYGLLNTFWVYIIPGLVSSYYVILIKTYVESMPPEVEESAMIDGANTMTIFFKIILPLSMPIAATIAIYASVGHWNSWFDNQMYNVNAPELTTLQYLLYRYLNQAEDMIEAIERGEIAETAAKRTPRSLKMTITVVTVVPILCVYPFMQRYLLKGIMIGAVKG